MEGAVRSGRLAAERIAGAAGGHGQLLAADLPPRGLMKLLARRVRM
jgi:hypothetical protein